MVLSWALECSILRSMARQVAWWTLQTSRSRSRIICGRTRQRWLGRPQSTPDLRRGTLEPAQISYNPFYVSSVPCCGSLESHVRDDPGQSLRQARPGAGSYGRIYEESMALPVPLRCSDGFLQGATCTTAVLSTGTCGTTLLRIHSPLSALAPCVSFAALPLGSRARHSCRSRFFPAPVVSNCR